MSLGKRAVQEKQESIWIESAALARPASHPFYERLNRILGVSKFDGFVEDACGRFYAKVGRPGLPPGVYFECCCRATSKASILNAGLRGELRILWRFAHFSVTN